MNRKEKPAATAITTGQNCIAESCFYGAQYSTTGDDFSLRNKGRRALAASIGDYIQASLFKTAAREGGRL